MVARCHCLSPTPGPYLDILSRTAFGTSAPCRCLRFCLPALLRFPRLSTTVMGIQVIFLLCCLLHRKGVRRAGGTGVLYYLELVLTEQRIGVSLGRTERRCHSVAKYFVIVVFRCARLYGRTEKYIQVHPPCLALSSNVV